MLNHMEWLDSDWKQTSSVCLHTSQCPQLVFCLVTDAENGCEHLLCTICGSDSHTIPLFTWICTTFSVNLQLAFVKDLKMM